MGKRVLVAEDEPNILRLLQVQLERAGCEVSVAEDGEQALKLLSEQQFDLAILDVMMPYVDGIAVLRQIRSVPATADLPVALLTVKAQDTDVIEGLDSGADLYLTKPFDPADVQRVLQLTRTPS
jgi:two-component system alkaline phosphatase synthesis response regulator PhoP/two-component system response regulator VicR